MQPTRRGIIGTLTALVAAALAGAPRYSYGLLQTSLTPPRGQSPNAPSNQNAPVGLDGSDIPIRNGGRELAPATWMEIKSDAQKLLTMATDFKTQVDSTNVNATLPVPLIQEAHKIEKLAKDIQNRMKS